MSILAICISAAEVLPEDDKSGLKNPTFEDAITLIKQFEGLSGSRHWPFVGYGHKVMPGDKFKRGYVLNESEADALVRKDYAALCARYREYGADSLLLAALAYNCGPGVVAKSSVLSRIKAGNRDIEDVYKAHCRYRGKQLKQLRRRRETELATLFIKEPNKEIIIDETSRQNESMANDSTVHSGNGDSTAVSLR